MTRALIRIGLALALFALLVAATEARDVIVLDGGRTGEVTFPHKKHGEALKDDCDACHALFPQEPGAIDKLKAGGKLEKRQVMNSCTACHKSRIKEKQPAGPVSCKGCHTKKEGP
jgi:hypothetical protein